MYLSKEKLQHINNIAHEGKVVVFATDADGIISYTVKQDGFEDSYLNTPADQRTGWENWKTLEFPNEEVDDQSVVDKQKAELTYETDPSKFVFKSRYRTRGASSVAPVQLVSALGHIYVFRQSTDNTLLVDRFVLDGMTNKLNRKLEVRFKRSKQKHQPTKNMNKGSNGLANIDSLDFRDANGNFFYEPTTELCAVNNLQKGWFSVVLVPTIENDVYRWHIFAYNSQTQKVELTTIRASEEGLFDVKDYTIFEQSNDTLVPRQIPGVIKRTLDISGAVVTNGLSATKYDLQQEQKTQSGEDQLIKTATKLLLAIPTDKGTAAFSFAIAGDGTLAEIDATPISTIIRSQQREILLPLNTLDEIKAIGDRTPPPKGIITGFAEGTDAENIEDLVKISTDGNAAQLANGDLVKITGTNDYQGLYYSTKKVDNNTFEIDVPSGNGLGYWEKEDQEVGGLIFDGMITAYQKTADGKLRVICDNHGLENNDEVQIAGTDDYNDTYPVQKIDDTNFVIERKWATGEAINVKLVSRKRRGVVFDRVDNYVSLPDMNHDFLQGFTVEAWVWYDSFQSYSRVIDFSNGRAADNIILCNSLVSNDLEFVIFKEGAAHTIKAAGALDTGKWLHLAATIDALGNATIYKNGQPLQTGKLPLPTVPNTLKRTKNYIGRSNWSEDAYFNGKISDLRIWKTARTAEDIKNSMYVQLTGKELSLVGYWRLGGISEGKVIDFSANGNDGTVYGDAYVSAATLNRKLAGGSDAVKYSNPELFAVSERATYEESFEFKVNPSTAVNLAYLDNADGNNLKTKIFTLSYWGKTSRSAEEEKPIATVQNKFEDLGNGWYRASCNFTIPDEVSMLRSFEIINIKGDWVSLEIRKHRIRLVSGSITKAKYTDSVTLAPLADSQLTLAAKLNQFELKEKQEANRLKEKRELEAKIAAYNAQAATRTEIERLKTQITRLQSEEQSLLSQYNAENENPLNYYCKIIGKQSDKLLVCIWSSTNYNPTRIYPDFNDDRQIWELVPAGGNFFKIKSKQSGKLLDVLASATHNCATIGIYHDTNSDNQSWEFVPAGDNFFKIKGKQSGKLLDVLASATDNNAIVCLHQDTNSDNQSWKLERTTMPTNTKVSEALANLQKKQNELSAERKKLAELEKILTATAADKAAWDARLANLIQEITAIQTESNALNTDFINEVKNDQKPQTMPQVAKDGKGLVTNGALLGFVQPASRLNAIETCEGNVQLSYFDTQGRMRQTNYDATADSKNKVFEEWIPDAQRACLNFGSSNSVVKLNKPLFLPADWTIEAWFFYPLPEAGEFNTLTRGENADHHILVRNRKQLGIYLNNDSLGQNFYDSGFNMELLPQGWHHIAAVGGIDTTRFYIDGKKVGDTKAKALADAEENLKKTPNDVAAKKKVEDIKKAILKVTSDVYVIGNTNGSGQQFGKVAEVRIWGVSLTEDEIAVNSKTLLSGNEPGLIAYYPLNEATGVEVRDNSGNGNNGTVSGANWWGCTAPIGNPGTTVMQFDGVNDYVEVPSHTNPTDAITISLWAKSNTPNWNDSGFFVSKRDAYAFHPNYTDGKSINFYIFSSGQWQTVWFTPSINITQWHHYGATFDGNKMCLYIDGVEVNRANYTGKINADTGVMCIGREDGSPTRYFNGQIAEVCIWNKARTQAEIQADMYKRLSGKESNLVAYYPLNEMKPEDSTKKVLDLAGGNHGTVIEAITVDDNTLPIGGDALVSSEYSSITVENTRKVALMRRFFAYPAANGAALLPDKRIEALELKWIGNAQFAPTLLGYIEGPPPVPSENLTLSDDYNGATSVELTMSEDVAFKWNRSEDSGLGGKIDTFIGADTEAYAGFGATAKFAVGRAGLKGNFDFSYQFQNDSSITSSSSLSMTDKLELRGTPEETAKFPHLGKRFIPKNIGYALVVSAIADVFVTRLARSGKMVGYQVQPVDGIPPDVNTITFLINPAYTMNGSLDGMTGSSATSARFFKHVPEMRSQYGSLYPASYYRLQEAYDLKRQIEAEDKRRESYFSNFDVRLIDETSLNRNIDSGDAPAAIGVQREEDKPNTPMTKEEKEKAEEEKLKNEKAEAAAKTKQQETASQQKQAEIQSKIGDQDKRVQATDSFAGWQKRMESLQIRAGKRNIVNTYVWDADGGLRTEAQSFADTVEHTIGGSFARNAGLGFEGKFGAGGFAAELTAQATVNMTQTMSKTETRSKGFKLNVDLGRLESKGITNYNDNPILPGEKVDRYRFMSFYLEGATQHFQDFFNYVVDPEWLASNDEEARALRQTKAGKPNKTWRILHRVTYVERPALMGFGRDVRKLRAAAAASSENQQLLGKIAKLEEDNRKLEAKLDKILDLLKERQ
ncbi:LamG-like jellyroll fold domain-containing protein [Microcoleus vaginatus]|uniref:LamG-like jellyroll fold domain-containing protein n=1 Tax=Microcoleus vaginatus TaxID=119532 RepID=UPI001682F181|nr:RICIN domain-containing protein [Microcoleus sp. FACHB-84]MBD2009810.1 RICIN domain-containing protein [Microcoleus sp. FACHB-45]